MKRFAVALVLSACASSTPVASTVHTDAGHGHGHGHGGEKGGDAVERALDDVARAHGAPGPWAVAGYRMGEHALARLGLARGSFDLEVEHTTPKKVQFSCIADGAGASTGASVGKLNLRVKEGAEADLVTVYRNKKTGAAVALRPSAAFRARYLDAPTTNARALGREVMTLPPDQVFEEVAVP